METKKTELGCIFEKCRYNNNFICTVPDEYEKCSRGNIFTLTEKIYEKYPDDKDIWVLLQEVVNIGQKINKVLDNMDKFDAILDMYNTTKTECVINDAELAKLKERAKDIKVQLQYD